MIIKDNFISLDYHLLYIMLLCTNVDKHEEYRDQQSHSTWDLVDWYEECNERNESQ